MPKIAFYGPGMGEHWHDANYGPTGAALGPGGVALSPDYAARHGYTLGDMVPYNGQYYRFTDYSYKRPGQPNKNTIEFWLGPNDPRYQVPPGVDTGTIPYPPTPPGPGASLPPDVNPFSYTPPGDVSVPNSPFDFSNLLSTPPPQVDSPFWQSNGQPGFDFSQYLNAPSSSDRPGLADLSSIFPPGSFPSSSPGTNENMQLSPADWFGPSSFNPPTNELMQPSPADNFSTSTWMSSDPFAQIGIQPFDLFGTPQGLWNPPTNEKMGPSETGLAPMNDPIVQSVGGNDIANFGGDFSLGPDFTAQNSWTDPGSGETHFYDSNWNWLYSSGSPASAPSSDTGPSQAAYNPLAQGSIGQPGGVQTIPSTIVGDDGMYYRFDPATGNYEPTGVMANAPTPSATGTGIYAPAGAFSGLGSGMGGAGPQFSSGGQIAPFLQAGGSGGAYGTLLGTAMSYSMPLPSGIHGGEVNAHLGSSFS